VPSWGARQSPRGARPGRPPYPPVALFLTASFSPRTHGDKGGDATQGEKRGHVVCRAARLATRASPSGDGGAAMFARCGRRARSLCLLDVFVCFLGGVRGRHFSINACKYEPNRFVPYRAVRLMRCRCGRAGCGGCVRGPCALGGAGVCGWCGGFNCVPSTRGAGRERNRKLL